MPSSAIRRTRFSKRRRRIKQRKGKPPRWAGYHFNLTPPGWFFFILMLLIMGAAVASGHNLLYLVVCLFFGSFIVMGNVAVMNLKDLQVKRDTPEEIHAGTPHPVMIHVSNPRRLMDSFALEIRETTKRDGRPDGSVFFPLVEKGKEATATYHLNLPARGWYELEGLEIMTRFPFGFWERSRRVYHPNRILVFPQVFHSWPEAAANLTTEGEFTGNRWGTGDELLNFRDYQVGDPIRWIHWKNTAKLDRLTVALYHHPKNRHVTVWLRTRYPENLSETIRPHFEEAVSWAATAVTRLIGKGVTVGYLDETARIPPADGEGQRIRILSHLALVPIGWTHEQVPCFFESGTGFGEETVLIEATKTGVRIEAGDRKRHFREAANG